MVVPQAQPLSLLVFTFNFAHRPEKELSFSRAGSGILYIRTSERNQVLKPNYQFEKRRKELEKKKKKDEKTQRKGSSTEESPVTETVVIPEKP